MPLDGRGEPAHASPAASSTGQEPPDLSFLTPPLDPGELGRLSHYRLIRLLGAGGMGMVFEAEDTHLLRLVALKVMRPELAASLANRTRFLKEARAAAAIVSDFVVPVYQVDQ